MKYAIILLILLTACTTEKKAYRIVNQDKFVDNNQRSLLSKPCGEQFPCRVDTVTTIVEIDSNEYKTYARHLEQYIDSISNNPTVVTVNDTVTVFRTVFTKQPPPITKYITNTVRVLDSAAVQKHIDAVTVCRQENEKLSQAATNAENRFKEARKDRWLWLLIGIALTTVGGWILKLKKII